jgi:hypothetical protein
MRRKALLGRRCTPGLSARTLIRASVVTAAQIDQIWRLPRAAYVHRSVAHSGGYRSREAKAIATDCDGLFMGTAPTGGEGVRDSKYGVVRRYWIDL